MNRITKGQDTKSYIIKQAAMLFNTKGYSGGSMSELMHLTGLKKGGIYNHFQTKEEIAVEAFDYSIRLVNKALHQITKKEVTATAKLRAIVNFYNDYPLNSVIIGGCPILNTAVEADDTNPILKERVQAALNDWIKGLSAIINKGIAQGEFKSNVDTEQAVIFIISSIEGGIVLTRSFDNGKYMTMVSRQLMTYIDELKI